MIKIMDKKDYVYIKTIIEVDKGILVYRYKWYTIQQK